MNDEFPVVKIIEMLRQERESIDGNIERVLDFILELEQSGKYSPANICRLKGIYYTRADDKVSALYWSEQAYLLEPTRTGYGWIYARKLMYFNRFNDALVVLSGAIDLEKEKGIQCYTDLCIFAKAVCYYYLKDYENCYHHLKDLEDDYDCWLAGGMHSKAEMMHVLKGFGY